MLPRFLPLFFIVPLCGGLLAGTPNALAAGGMPQEQKDAKTEEAVRSADEGQWKRVPQGSRPAYAGIQGGTVPVTLLQASNGTIFVIPGRTGNDFTHVLRGTNGTPENAPQAAKPSPQTAAAPQQPETTAQAPATAPAPQPQAASQPGASAQAVTPAAQPAAEQSASSAQPAETTQSAQAKTHEAQPQAAALAHATAPAVKPAAVQDNQATSVAKQADAAAKQAEAAQPAQAKAPAPQAQNATAPAQPVTEPAAQTAQQAVATAQQAGTATAETPATPQAQAEPSKPQEEHVVFASSDLAARLHDEAELTPFGLSADAKEVVERQLQPARPVKPVRREAAPFKPLRLGSYTLLLSKR